MKFVSLFSGIGGLDLGLERAGMKCVLQVEENLFARAVLEHHFPGISRINDVREVTAADVKGVDLIAGGFPCQDISFAGKGAGINGERSGLWAEFFRLIRESRPSFVLIENVPALFIRGIERVLGDIASIGYDAEWQTIQASDFRLPHRRKRVFIVAYPNSFDGKARMGNREKTEIFRSDRKERNAVHVQAAPSPDRMDDGIPSWIYQRAVQGLGNAVAVPVGEWIGKKIIATKDLM